MQKDHQPTDKVEDRAKRLHIPVLTNEVLFYLEPKRGQSYLDLTGGYGGHAAEVLKRTGAVGRAVLVDRDAEAVDALKKRFAEAEVIHQDFLQASRQLAGSGRRFDIILADLGLSSAHLENAERGFSLNRPGPLDMRMDNRGELTAAQIVNQASAQELSDILRRYGQEPKAEAIARKIVRSRPIRTTEQLADLVGQLWPKRGRLHPATRTFQALRIAVNDELALLEQSLPIWANLLEKGGRLVVISFHSLEDRIVKRFFAEHSGDRYDAEFKLLTKKPVTPSPDEIVSNPRARSAKLRACSKK